MDIVVTVVDIYLSLMACNDSGPERVVPGNFLYSQRAGNLHKVITDLVVRSVVGAVIRAIVPMRSLPTKNRYYNMDTR